MTDRYANFSRLDINQSQNEIARHLRRFGISTFKFSEEEGEFAVVFYSLTKVYHITIPVPLPDNEAFWYTEKTNRLRDHEVAEKLYQHERNRRWRALTFLVKAKCVAIDDGITKFEAEFSPFLVKGGANSDYEDMALAAVGNKKRA